MIDGIRNALREIWLDLRASFPRDRFYYFTVLTTGEALAPCVSAWSVEALNHAVAGAVNLRGVLDLKWSYADSPFYNYGDARLGAVRETFLARPGADLLSGDAWDEEFSFRLECMEEALRSVDAEGLFGRGEQRNEIVINVELMPPDASNVERARRLNPPAALVDWMIEAAEEG